MFSNVMWPMKEATTVVAGLVEGHERGESEGEGKRDGNGKK